MYVLHARTKRRYDDWDSGIDSEYSPSYLMLSASGQVACPASAQGK
jgi:hypothetical protein